MSECNDCSFGNWSYDPPYDPFKEFYEYHKNKDQFDSIASLFSSIPILSITKVIWNDDAVIVLWSDRTKTVVKRMESDDDDIYAAVAQAIAKKIYGGTGSFHSHVDSVLKDYRTPTDIDENFIMESFRKLYKGIFWSFPSDNISTQD